MKKQVLLCDDEIHVIRPAEITLRRAGYDVSIAADGDEAWQMIQRQMPDLLITDIKMPGLDGWQLCDRVRQTESMADLPIFVLTGKAYDVTEAEMAEKWNVLKRISKPYSPRRLLRQVDSLLNPDSDSLESSCEVINSTSN